MAKRCTCPETIWKAVPLGWMLGCKCGAIEEERAEKAGIFKKSLVEDLNLIDVSFVSNGVPLNLTGGAGGGGGAGIITPGTQSNWAPHGGKNWYGYMVVIQDKDPMALCSWCSNARYSVTGQTSQRIRVGWRSTRERCDLCYCPACMKPNQEYPKDSNGTYQLDILVCHSCGVESIA